MHSKHVEKLFNIWQNTNIGWWTHWSGVQCMWTCHYVIPCCIPSTCHSYTVKTNNIDNLSVRKFKKLMKVAINNEIYILNWFSHYRVLTWLFQRTQSELNVCEIPVNLIQSNSRIRHFKNIDNSLFKTIKHRSAMFGI
jgi:hypothetical protein